MKKLLSQILVLLITVTTTVATFAQSPNNATRQRRTSSDGTQQATGAKGTTTAGDKTSDSSPDKDKTKAPEVTTDQTKVPEVRTNETKLPEVTPDKTKLPEVTPDGKTNRTDEDAESQAIVPYYNNFFTNYRLGPDDIISVNVFQQEKYSKQGIKIPPSGRIYLALIPEGLFVNGKTPDQVADLIKKRYDEYIIDPEVSVTLDQAGSYRYSVVGDVSVPGIKLMSRRLSVSEAVAEAGGVLQTGDRSKVFVLRKQQDGTLKPIPINLTAVYKGQAPDSVYLVPGDQVIVPGNKLKKLQTILGFAQIMTFANLFRGGW
jgi:polysaccharide export outer membrane protein